MSTALKTRRSRQQRGNADPAHAFGSEEQLMSEFQRQEYVQPQPKPRAFGGIRERLANLTARPHETDAPVYSAETYQRESAPDLGWEAAFDPEAARQAPPETPSAPSAEERFEQFRQTVYSSPSRYRPAPVYEEISLRSAPPRESSYQKPVYEEISFGARERRASPQIEAPLYEDLTPGPRRPAETEPIYDESGFYPEAADGAPGPYEPAPAPTPTVRGASDLQYAFWSGSILVGVALTLFAFVYACVM